MARTPDAHADAAEEALTRANRLLRRANTYEYENSVRQPMVAEAGVLAGVAQAEALLAIQVGGLVTMFGGEV